LSDQTAICFGHIVDIQLKDILTKTIKQIHICYKRSGNIQRPYSVEEKDFRFFIQTIAMPL